MSVNPTDHLNGWDPASQPRTRSELQAMVRHALYVRWPNMKLWELQDIAEAVLIGFERYGVAFRRTAWKRPENAQLHTQTLADLGTDTVEFACGACSRVESHKRRHLMDRFGSFRAVYEVPPSLSADCGERKKHGPNWCRFNYIQNVRPVTERDLKWRVRQSRS